VAAVEHKIGIDFEAECNALVDLRILEDAEVDVVEAFAAEDVSWRA
jgi:hypothetical protein